MTSAEVLRRVADAPIARLATVRDTGAPHIVPVVFAYAAAGVDESADPAIVTAVDHKPKRTHDLARLRAIAHEPRVSVLVDHYDEDWDRLWWIRVDGHARIVDGEAAETARDLLCDKYSQYDDARPEGPAVAVTALTWRWWSADDSLG
ncbi:TIGR03668 family PPOX class F420-dependent oxidoreductase [Rhodococcus rhodnii]|uniref:Pyridoxamine 5'-phosphate oxidase N-terminal domain-containing protein n=2 Tax=Rhodococcus rhodnii TaxID=38312 RepID=R7WNP5_9NOCA|nr:TIGR03668 family PPOX class F420-dependent oxidoreductase [Rhodococcus rhodnii]EOM76895.1 hypothetical protein Rrhod_1808 [Rhodococcus rhodnii LMG 5362]TXG89743.1 TIGR03668 family PPOX class F420-dependent oxidoreductase [Rhodococcus rhodnii]